MMNKTINENRDHVLKQRASASCLNAFIVLIIVLVAEIAVFISLRHTIVYFIETRKEDIYFILNAFDAFSCVILILDLISVSLFCIGWKGCRKTPNYYLRNRYVKRSMFFSSLSFFLYFATIIITPYLLVIISSDVEYGITRRLPPPVEQNDEDVKVKERNVMIVMVNKNDKLLVNGRVSDLSTLKDEVKFFMTPRPDDETAPEVETKHFDLVGDVLMSKGVISLQNDRGTSYAMYISVQNELASAFNELQEEMALKKFQKHLDQLTEDELKAIREAVPVRVSEAEPVQ